ncbi:hypothetical protein ABZ341_36185 [Streptomyces sp. NPDC006173]|uniref:hypothetical protein n=1 Tax=Streptomyces sp. NPDC006173 TaxID=3155349 RepID=UPI00340A8015
MLGDGKTLERDPVDAEGQPIPQWGSDAIAKLSPREIVNAQEKGHLNRYLLGDQVETVEPPQRPEQYTAEQVATMSTKELAAAAAAGHLVDYMATPTAQPAGGAEL